MSTRQQGEEPEQRGGLGGRVRRFIDSELGLGQDKDDRKEDESRAEHRHENPENDMDRYEEPATPRADTPGHADHPVATTPAEPRHETPVREPVREPPVHETREAPVRDTPRSETRVAQPVAEQPRRRTRDEAAIDASAERVGLLNNPADLRDHWQQVQSTFVDDPQRAVEEASSLVERTLREIHANVTRRPADDPTSTEDLRVSFQRYREFFDRLLSA
ncbi:MAG: hypothetical protein ACRDSH_16030 [Pseudonocardiaceae bacterium]